MLILAAVFVVISVFLYYSLSSTRTSPDFLYVSGSVEAKDVSVGSRIGGRLIAVHVKEGDTVNKGALIAEFDVAELTAQRLTLEANLLESTHHEERLGDVVKSLQSSQSEALALWEDEKNEIQDRFDSLSETTAVEKKELVERVQALETIKQVQDEKGKERCEQIKHLIQQMDELGPASLRSAVLMQKEGRARVPFKPDLVGFEIPNKYVVGYGLQYMNRYRNLPSVVVLEPDDMAEESPA